jgi:hypothetical protein
MKVICSWCKSEGHVGLVRDKAPLTDARETHGICAGHLQKLAGRNTLNSREGDSPYPHQEAVLGQRTRSAALTCPE